MSEKTDEKKFTVYEWTIENFSYWRNEFHGLRLLTEPRSNMAQFDFFRGTFPFPDRMFVKIRNVHGKVKGDFSLICPNGSLVWTTRVDKDDDDEDNVFIGVVPLNFMDLVALIRNNEADHGDRLLLRLRFENGERSVLHSMHSMFEVRTISMKISLSSILNVQPEPSALRRVITADYPLSDGTTEKFKVRISESLSSKIELKLRPYFSKEEIYLKTRMSVLHNDGSVIRTEENEDEILRGYEWIFSDSLTRNEVVLEGLSILLQLTVLPSKTLKHLFILSSPFVTEVTTNSASSNMREKHAVDALLKDFSCFHQNEDFSDLQLNCEGVSFPVHKSILVARSLVFKRMFSSDMEEAGSGSVDIVDLDAPTLARFLTFLYSGIVKDNLQSESALKLYYAADKYQVLSLKTACVNFLSHMSTKTVCDVLTLADKHQDKRLLSAAHSFIVKNFTGVLMSKEWESLTRRDSFLAVKTLNDLARRGHLISPEEI